MSDDKSILEQAIQKALSNGYDEFVGRGLLGMLGDVLNYPEADAREIFIRGFIFNHDFAKALWGEEFNTKHYYMFDDGTHYRERDDRIANWQYHLQQMVIATNPIEYLGARLDD